MSPKTCFQSVFFISAGIAEQIAIVNEIQLTNKPKEDNKILEEFGNKIIDDLDSEQICATYQIALPDLEKIKKWLKKRGYNKISNSKKLQNEASGKTTLQAIAKQQDLFVNPTTAQLLTLVYKILDKDPSVQGFTNIAPDELAAIRAWARYRTSMIRTAINKVKEQAIKYCNNSILASNDEASLLFQNSFQLQSFAYPAPENQEDANDELSRQENQEDANDELSRQENQEDIGWAANRMQEKYNNDATVKNAQKEHRPLTQQETADLFQRFADEMYREQGIAIQDTTSDEQNSHPLGDDSYV